MKKLMIVMLGLLTLVSACSDNDYLTWSQTETHGCMDIRTVDAEVAQHLYELLRIELTH